MLEQLLDRFKAPFCFVRLDVDDLESGFVVNRVS